MSELEVTAIWNAKSAIWVAHSDEVPGLSTEADTLENLIPKLKALISQLVETVDRSVGDGVAFVVQVDDVAHALEEAVPRNNH